jgi:hypothetical protein
MWGPSNYTFFPVASKDVDKFIVPAKLLYLICFLFFIAWKYYSKLALVFLSMKAFFICTDVGEDNTS